ncbi:MAG: 3'-5' exonuclease [Candidatus Magasanikbacteria bacterium CG_4_10_14_0_2_um_filter_37_12]|uniref:3'-5' exonuclease n=1 Tax=Candidatus Magasanikbacteria bacterium CG_4_10_14_0_2_um_filter_37_12 TaxID=1974637 RepID=A0A2M7VA02_9BACT|nr:MAG: 3'-5' exonuclease [Candidatus Magasanikbacteria bacterium CG_4_10_14_0_2_um_filter_37_12]
MKTIVFDIETIPIDFDSLDTVQQEYLLKFAEDEDDKEKTKDKMALWAPTNKIVAIGVLSVEDQKGAVYYQDESGDKNRHSEGPITFCSGSEKEILQMFWDVMSYASRFVTFNGRGFDCPVLMLRSAMYSVHPSKNLVPYRYSTDIHVDLLEQLTFYSASRKFNLDFYCKAFGIDSPKSNGITGHDVKDLFKEGRFVDIARYCAGDLWATRELYLRWKEYMYFGGR